MDYGYNIFSKSILISVGRILSVAHESEGVSVGLASVILYKKLKTRSIEMLNAGSLAFVSFMKEIFFCLVKPTASLNSQSFCAFFG